MPFWMHEPIIKTRLRMISLRQRCFWSCVALLMVTSAIYMKFVYPKKLLVTHDEINIKTLQQKVISFADVKKIHHELKVSCEALKKSRWAAWISVR